MNKTLLQKVKDKCKDTRLSEKYLTAITEKLGGSIEDDSTDEEAIETTANLIAEVATESQGEATRWAQKAKGKAKSKPANDDDDSDDDSYDDDTTTKGKKGKGKGKPGDNSDDEIAELRKRLDEVEAERTRGARKAEIDLALEKHKIPAFLRDTFRKSIADDDDVETVVAAFKQDCITNGLVSDQQQGSKAASEKQVDEAADALLETITAK